MNKNKKKNLSEESNTTSYLLRDIPRDKWKEVRDAAYNQHMSIKDFIMKVIEDELKREKSRKETD